MDSSTPSNAFTVSLRMKHTKIFEQQQSLNK